MEFGSPAFWVAVAQIIAIDIVLGGDNAVVIALACRGLPSAQRKQGILWGVAGAIGLRVVLVFFAITLLTIAYLKIVGALLLLWIGVKLMQPEGGDGKEIAASEIAASATLIGAIRTIIIADAVMSLDNVVAIAGAAKGSIVLVVFGLIVSVPFIVWGSQLILKFMDRYPIIIVAGAALLGWIAGGMAVHDAVIKDWVAANMPLLDWIGPVVGAALVVALAKMLYRAKPAAEALGVVDLAADKEQ